MGCVLSSAFIKDEKILHVSSNPKMGVTVYDTICFILKVFPRKLSGITSGLLAISLEAVRWNYKTVDLMHVTQYYLTPDIITINNNYHLYASHNITQNDFFSQTN